MKMALLWRLLLAVLVPAQVAAESADSASQPQAEPWHGERSLGFNRSTGNSSVQNLQGKIRLSRKSPSWDIDMKAEAFVSSDGERKTRQTVIADIQTGFNFAESAYSFANLRYTDDRFGPFTEQTSLSAGLGWRPFDSERGALVLDGGLGVRHSEQRITQNRTSKTVLRGKLDWQYQITETARLLKNFRVESGPDNTLVESETAVRLKINTDLGLKLSYRLRTNSQVPQGTSDTDSLTAVSLDFLF